MSSQLISADTHSHKIVFSHLHCKISLPNTAQFAFVIRIGKTSSKYTEKKEIHQGILDFDSVLELPISSLILEKQSSKKEKCEIMLYKFRLNREKESKELVGMASVTVSGEMAENESKRLRLTNSFDKEAFIECQMRTELGEAEILSHNFSQSSFFHIKSEENSLHNESTESKVRQKRQNGSASPCVNHVKIGLITSNSRNSLREDSNQKSKGNNSLLDLLIRVENDSTPLVPVKEKQIKSEQAVRTSEFPALKQESGIKVEQFADSKEEIEVENHKLKEMCRQLQEQNKALKITIQGLQNQALNQSMISNKSVSSENPNIPKPGGISKRSPMIKKNAAITVVPSFSKLQNSNVLTEDLNNQQTELRIKPPQKGSIRAQRSKLANSQLQEGQKSPYFDQKSSRVMQELKFTHEHLELPLSLTFAGQRLTQRNRFSLNPVIEVRYIPAKNHENTSGGLNKSVSHSSISELEKKNCRSYSKFNGRKKYQVIGAIKNENQTSQINSNSFDQGIYQNAKRQGGSIIVGKPSGLNKKDEKSFHFNNPKQNYPNGLTPKGGVQQTNFLDFLKEKQVNEQHKNQNQGSQNQTPKNSVQRFQFADEVLINQNKQNEMFVFVDMNGQRRSRLTLEDLDIKTEEMFRKNERFLKISNMRITEENRKLKEDKKVLQKELKQKQGLTHQELNSLKNEVQHMKSQLEISLKVKQESEKKCAEMTQKFTSLEEQNLKLKKDLREQKSKYDYYFKMGNINDDKEKQKERENIRPWEKELNHKKSSDKLSSEALTPEEVSKALNRNNRSVTSISNFNKEDSIKFVNQENKFGKNGQNSLDKNGNPSEKQLKKKVSFNEFEFSKPPTSSTAISKLKMHVKPINTKTPTSGVLSQIQSPANSVQSASLGELVSGLIGTGQTVIENHRPSNFFSKK